MTVVVGMTCADGALLAADSQASDPSSRSAFQMEKIWPVGDVCVVGASGHTAIADAVRADLQSSVHEMAASPIPARGLRDLAAPHMRAGYREWIDVPGVQMSPATSFLTAGVANGMPWLAELEPNGMLNQYENTLGYYAIGSGAGFAQMAMALLAHFSIRERPTSIGKLIAYRVIDAVIMGSMAGVGYPINIWTVAEGDGCQQVSEGEMQEIGVNVGAWREAENEALSAFLGEERQAPADLPPEL